VLLCKARQLGREGLCYG
nr:immunoglobulin heavy chain junction region [Mus musculus]